MNRLRKVAMETFVFAESALKIFKQKLLSGLIWNALNSLSVQGATLVSSIILANFLGIKEFGAFSLLVATATMVANFAQGGSGLVATKFVAENLYADPLRVGRVIGLCRLTTIVTSLVATILIFIFAHQISAQILGKVELIGGVRLVALAIFFQVAVTYQIGALQGFGEFKELSKASAISGLAYLLSLSIGGWVNGVNGALCGFVIANALRSVICWYYLDAVCRKHGIAPTLRIHREDLELVWRVAVPAGLAGLVAVPAMWAVNVSISRLPDGLVLVGIFSVGHQIRLAGLQLPSLLNSVTFSVLSRMKSDSATKEFRNVFLTTLIGNSLFACLMATALVLTARPLLGLWSIDSEDGVLVLWVLAISIIPELISMSIYQLVQSAGKMWSSLFKIAIPRDGIYLLLALYFLPLYGLSSAAYAYFSAQMLGLFATVLIVRRI